MKNLTIYRAKHKSSDLVLLFKYDLNGHLKEFNVEEGELTDNQIVWLFFKNNFPALESLMKTHWILEKKYKQVFEIEKFKADISFESFWEIWGLKVKKESSEKAWNKLGEAEKIKCFLSFKKYQEHLSKTGQAKAHLVTWINQKRFNDEY